MRESVCWPGCPLRPSATSPMIAIVMLAVSVWMTGWLTNFVGRRKAGAVTNAATVQVDSVEAKLANGEIA